MRDQVVKNKMNNKRNVQVFNKCLLNTIIDKDFQAALYPMNMIQSVFLISKYSFVNNHVIPKNNISHSIISGVGATVLVLSHFFRFFYYIISYGIRSDVVTFLLYFDIIFYTTISFLIHVVSHLQCGNTVELIIRLQRVLNVIKIDKKRFLFKITIENWIITLLFVTYHILMWLSHGGVDAGLYERLVGFFLAVPVLIFDIHIIIVTRMVVFIRNELIAWNRVMEKYKIEAKREINVEALEEIANNELSESVIFDSYVDIVKAFGLCNEIYQFTFIYFVIQTFVQVLINLEVVIEFGKLGTEAGLFQSITMRIISGFWNLKNFGLLVTLSVACENFYGTVKMVEGSCAQILNSDRASGLRKVCKNVVRINRATFRKLSAFGLFELDAAFPARLLGGLVAYTVVLLQFAFL